MSNLTDCSKLDIPAIVGPAQVGQSLEQSQYDFVCKFVMIMKPSAILQIHFQHTSGSSPSNLRPNRLECCYEAISEPVKVPLGPNKAPLSKPRLPSNLGWLLGSQPMLLKILISSLRPSWLGSWFSEIMHFRQGLV